VGLFRQKGPLPKMGKSRLYDYLFPFILINMILMRFDLTKKGETGFPWIDACMRQMRQEGWIHHVCRNSLAVFLTRGVLFLSWEQGLKVFFHFLIDVREYWLNSNLN
jgi:deoxyribodipyrimidine photolyase